MTTEGPRLLIASYDRTLRASLWRMLADAGYQLSIATDGLQAQHQRVAQRFDAVVCDTTMPAMDGLELVSTLRKNLELRSIPFIVLTGRCAPTAVS